MLDPCKGEENPQDHRQHTPCLGGFLDHRCLIHALTVVASK
jgi:hypothetical protein